jgi:hypothetical protein
MRRTLSAVSGRLGLSGSRQFFRASSEEIRFDDKPEEAPHAFHDHSDIMHRPQVQEFLEEEGRPEIECAEGNLPQSVDVVARHGLRYKCGALVGEIR